MTRSGKQFKIGLSLDEAKPLLGKKVMLNPRQIRKALSIVGIGRSGIKNLSESVHEYRRMAKRIKGPLHVHKLIEQGRRL